MIICKHCTKLESGRCMFCNEKKKRKIVKAKKEVLTFDEQNAKDIARTAFLENIEDTNHLSHMCARTGNYTTGHFDTDVRIAEHRKWALGLYQEHLKGATYQELSDRHDLTKRIAMLIIRTELMRTRPDCDPSVFPRPKPEIVPPPVEEFVRGIIPTAFKNIEEINDGPEWL